MRTPPAAPGTIELNVQSASQLFNSLDPAPFHERDLDRDAEEFIVSWAREFPRKAPIRVVIHMPAAEANAAQPDGIAKAFKTYFGLRAVMAERERRELMRLGRIYLLIGLPVLAACLALSQLADNVVRGPAMLKAIEESLIIVGWVVNWKTIETFLYDWQPIARRRDLYRRLEAAEVRVDGH